MKQEFCCNPPCLAANTLWQLFFPGQPVLREDFMSRYTVLAACRKAAKRRVLSALPTTKLAVLLGNRIRTSE